MEQNPIKIPRPIKASSFAIPLVKDADEHQAMKDFGQYLKLLESWGFERLLSTRSLAHSSLAQKSPSDRVENYELWQHPAGVLAKLSSYTQASYMRYDGTMEPARHALSSIWLDAKVDAGTGPEVQHRSSVELRGTGGSSPLFDGRSVRTISETVHSNTGTSLYGFLNMIQQHGRLLPFEQWDKDRDRTGVVHIAPELIAPVLDWPEGQLFVIEDFDARMAATLGQLPENLSSLFARQEQRQKDIIRRRNDPNATQRQGLAWDPVEFGINVFSEALFLAGKRWPKPAECDLLEHWSRVALGEWGETFDPERMRAYEKGPAGLSLPVALLYAKQSAPHAAALLEQVLLSAPIEVLQRWATQPDAAGYTLGLRAVARSFTDRAIDSHHPSEVDVLGILHRRLGPEGLVMATPTRSLLGLVLQQRPNGNTRDMPVRKLRHADLATAIERLDGWGVKWGEHLRWRNYPNLYQDKDKPAFFRVDGPVDPRQWSALMGHNLTPELGVVMARLEHLGMAAATPRADTPPRPPARRL